jgi:long-subunit acyl-CoA synthetase (AMP-forming)
VATRQVGELIVRTAAPWAMSHGYNGNPEATAASWRNGWFHTGDAFLCDEDGDFHLVDRLKDTATAGAPVTRYRKSWWRRHLRASTRKTRC